MPVTTVIDIDFYYGLRPRPISVENRIVVPLGNKIVWRFNIPNDPNRQYPYYLNLNVELYFEGRSPFGWTRKSASFRTGSRMGELLPVEVAAETAESEGEYKYGIRVRGEGTNERIDYDEDPYLIIRRF